MFHTIFAILCLIFLSSPTTARATSTTYTGSSPASVVNYTLYDANGNLKTLNENGTTASTITREYDALNRITSYTARAESIGYRYYANGLLAKIIYPGGTEIGTGHVEYTYDINGRLYQVIDKLTSSTTPRTTTYSWFSDGRLQFITRPNGTQRSIVYEPATGRPQTLTEKAGTTTLLEWSLSYYPSDEIKTLNLSPALAPSLLAAAPSAVMTHDAANRLLTWNSQATTYDLDGNMRLGPVPKTQTLGAFAYDSRNRLTSGGGLTYTYDAENHRTGIAGNAGTGFETTAFTVDPNGAMSKILARTKNGVTTRYVYGAGLQYEVSAAGVATYYHYDQAGNTAALSNASGALTERMAYTAYGSLRHRSGNTDTPFLYGGFFGVMTDSNGLLHMRARYYNPLTLRFMNADPARDGWNWHAYADGNPVNWADPSGYGAIGSIQAGLSAVGMVPGIVGGVANLTNGFISMARGDDVGMISSFAGAATFGVSSLATYGAISSATAIGRSVGPSVSMNAVRIETSFGARAGAGASGIPGVCFVAGTEIGTAGGGVAIESLRVGQRVLTADGGSSTEVDPVTWRKITLRMSNPECPEDVLDLELLRPVGWMAATECEEGAQIWFDLEEMGLHGLASVQKVSVCPPVQPGRGRVVLATVNHENTFVMEVRLEGGAEPLRPTDRHPLFSVTRNDWVPTAFLKPGEELRTATGTAIVSSVRALQGTHRVYNIEVEIDHNYYAGPDRVLSHNSCMSGAANTAGRGPVIVGETMSRVTEAARGVPGAKILNDMPTFTGTADQVTSSMMQYNRKWILDQMRSGRPIIDIGTDATRQTPSIFYQMEQNMMQNYQKLNPGSLNISKP